MKTKITKIYLEDFTFQRLFNQFIPPAQQKKAHRYAISALVASYCFILLAFYLKFTSSSYFFLSFSFLIPLPIFLNIAERTRKIGIQAVLLKKYQTEELENSIGMHIVEINELSKVLTECHMNSLACVNELIVQISEEAQAVKKTLVHEFPALSIIFTLIPAIILLIIGPNPSIEVLKSVTTLLVLGTAAYIIFYYIINTLFHEIFNGKSKKLEGLVLLLKEIKIGFLTVPATE